MWRVGARRAMAAAAMAATECSMAAIGNGCTSSFSTTSVPIVKIQLRSSFSGLQGFGSEMHGHPLWEPLLYVDGSCQKSRMSTMAWNGALASIPLLVQGRHMDLSDDVKSHVEEKIAKAIIDQSRLVREVDVRLSKRESERGPKLHRCEATLFTKKHGVIRAEEEGDTIYASIDNVSNLLSRKLHKLKDKLGLHGRLRPRARLGDVLAKAAKKMPPVQRDSAVEEEDEEEEEEEEEDLAVTNEIVREKFFDMQPMLPREALVRMENVGHDFYAFRNSGTGEINVVYKRRQGGYGVIAPSATSQKPADEAQAEEKLS